VNDHPADTSTASDSPVTDTGTELAVVDPSPSSPSALLPQQMTWPVARTAQVWVKPSVTPCAAAVG
jgi:hypothetical protein